MADEEKMPAEGEEAPKKKGLFENKLVVILVVLAVQVGMAFAAAQFVIKPVAMGGSGDVGVRSASEEGEERERGTIVSLEEMVVSLSAPGRTRYLRTTIALEAGDTKTAAEIGERMPEFRDAAILRLSSYTPEDLHPYEGKEAAKTEIKAALKSLLPNGELLNVYFSDFVVQ